jgi:hypothetical protein
VDVEFGGADEFRALAKRLEGASERGVVTEAIAKGLAGILPEAQAAVARGAQRLPKRGGLARRVGQTRLAMRVTNRGGVYRASIKALPNAVADPGALNRGRAAHPVYGREPNVFQKVPPNWFSEPLRGLKPQIVAAINRALAEAIRKI